jgi:hypothetical protein
MRAFDQSTVAVVIAVVVILLIIFAIFAFGDEDGRNRRGRKSNGRNGGKCGGCGSNKGQDCGCGQLRNVPNGILTSKASTCCSGFPFTFDSTLRSPTGLGTSQVRFNGTSCSNTSQVYVNAITTAGANIYSALSALGVGTILQLTQNGASNIFTVTSVTSGNGQVTYGVTPLTCGGTFTSAPVTISTAGTTAVGGIAGTNGINGTNSGGIGGYAEFVQLTQGTNVSVAPGTAVSYLVDNPVGVFNSLGITFVSGPGGQGTAFLLPIGTYMVDFEHSAGSASSFAIYRATSLGALAGGVDNNTIAGSTTATTWIHGRAIVNAAAPTYLMISSVVGIVAIVPAGTAAGFYVARITFLAI